MNCFDQLAGAILGTQQEVRCHEWAFVSGVVVFGALKIWEIVDVWASPPAHNHRYHELRRRVDGVPATELRWGILPAVTSRARVDGLQVGLQLKF